MIQIPLGVQRRPRQANTYSAAQIARSEKREFTETHGDSFVAPWRSFAAADWRFRGRRLGSFSLMDAWCRRRLPESRWLAVARVCSANSPNPESC
jgi:hypothetical protein